ncbi:hypothetical protein BJ741DRAFT_639531, partial [Chytriomyces cf. hyalinus JEL632]
MPTATQLAELEAVTLRQELARNAMGVAAAQEGCGNGLGFEMPGLPTTRQLLQFDRAILLNKAMRWPTVESVVTQDDDIDWDDGELPGMPTDAQLADFNNAILLNRVEIGRATANVELPQDNGADEVQGVAAAPIHVPQIPELPHLAPLEAPQVYLPEELWADFNEWFNENILVGGMNFEGAGAVREDAVGLGDWDAVNDVIRDVFGGDQVVAVPEEQLWQ